MDLLEIHLIHRCYSGIVASFSEHHLSINAFKMHSSHLLLFCFIFPYQSHIQTFSFRVTLAFSCLLEYVSASSVIKKKFLRDFIESIHFEVVLLTVERIMRSYRFFLVFFLGLVRYYLQVLKSQYFSS